MYIVLSAPVPVAIVSAYARPADHDTEDKDASYDELDNAIEELRRKYIVYLNGDFNARVQVQPDDTEVNIGPYTLEPTEHRLDSQGEQAADNRARFIALTNTHDLKAMNTYFPKPSQFLATYKEMGVEGPPYIRGSWNPNRLRYEQRYEQLDFMLVQSRWKNSVKNVQADPKSNIESSHNPLIATIEVKLKSMGKPHQEPKASYLKCTEEQQNAYNEALREAVPGPWTYANIWGNMKEQGQKHIPAKPQKKFKDFISKPTQELIQRRGQLKTQRAKEEELK